MLWRSLNHSTLRPQLLDLSDNLRKVIVGQGHQISLQSALTFFYSCTVKLNPDVGLQDHYWTYYYYCKDVLQGNGYMGCTHAQN